MEDAVKREKDSEEFMELSAEAELNHVKSFVLRMAACGANQLIITIHHQRTIRNLIKEGYTIAKYEKKAMIDTDDQNNEHRYVVKWMPNDLFTF